MPAKKKTAPVKLTANPRGSARVSKKPPLTPAQLKQIDAYWRASNYLTACQLYLLDNPLLERPLTAADLKQTIVGHWGTCPGFGIQKRSHWEVHCWMIAACTRTGRQPRRMP